MSHWHSSGGRKDLFRGITRWKNPAVFLSSKIAVALTLLLVVMFIGVSGFMIFTTHMSAIQGHTGQMIPDSVSTLPAQTGETGTVTDSLYQDDGSSKFSEDLLLSLYMTAITITTVGFDDVVRNYAYESMDTNWRRAYNIWVTCFVILAYLAILYVNANFVAYLVGTRLAENMKRRVLLRNISSLSGHYIVCGCTGAGSVVINEFLRVGIPVVGIDNDPEPPHDLRKRNGFFYLSRDRSDEVLLAEAGIDEARGLVSVLSDDSDNLYLTLTAHLMNGGLKIVSRAVDSETEEKLSLVGASATFTPSVAVGKKLVGEFLSGDTMDFVEKMIDSEDQDCRIEEYTISDDCPSRGRTLEELKIAKRTGAQIFAVMKDSGSVVYNPRADYVLQAGDVLLTIESPGGSRSWRRCSTEGSEESDG